MPAPEPKPITHVRIPLALANGILSYLLRQPLGEVNDLFHALKEATETSFKEQSEVSPKT